MKRLMFARMAVLVVAVTVGVAACDAMGTSPDDDSSSGENGSDVVEVHLTSSYTFSPADLTIEPGTTVRWVNDTDIFHTITPDGHSEWTRQEMSSTGQTFEHTFTSVGTFPYLCEPHESQGMTGVITVEATEPDDGGLY